jgi:hypothetical protein
MPSLSIELRTGESVAVSGPARITLEEKSGGRARLRIVADEGVSIDRPQRQVSGADLAQKGLRPGVTPGA